MHYRTLCVYSLAVVSLGGCSGSPGTSSDRSSIARLAISLRGSPSLTATSAATSFPVTVTAFANDGTPIVGAYDEGVTVALESPVCSTLGLVGGSPQSSATPYSPTLCGPIPPKIDGALVTLVSSSATAVSLAWDGTPIGAPGILKASAPGVATVQVTFPTN